MLIIHVHDGLTLADFLVRIVWLLIGGCLGYFMGTTRTSYRMCREMAGELHKAYKELHEIRDAVMGEKEDDDK